MAPKKQPGAPTVILPTPAELTAERARFSFVHFQGRGWGVVSKKTIPADTRLMVYPGVVTRHGSSDNARMDGTYKWAFFKLNKTTGNVDTAYNITARQEDRMYANGRPKYAAPCVNEPPPGKSGNVQVVWNFVREPPALEYWSLREIKPGDELFVCYGRSYQRNYTHNSTCSAAPSKKFLYYPQQTIPSKDRLYGSDLANALASPTWLPPAERRRRALVQRSLSPSPSRSPSRLPSLSPRLSPKPTSRKRSRSPSSTPSGSRLKTMTNNNKTAANALVQMQREVQALDTPLAPLLQTLEKAGKVLASLCRKTPAQRAKMPGLAVRQLPVRQYVKGVPTAQYAYETQYRDPRTGMHVFLNEEETLAVSNKPTDWILEKAPEPDMVGIDVDFGYSVLVAEKLDVFDVCAIRCRSHAVVVTLYSSPSMRLTRVVPGRSPKDEALDRAVLKEYISNVFPRQFRGIFEPWILNLM
jgi:hypothetical protein